MESNPCHSPRFRKWDVASTPEAPEGCPAVIALSPRATTLLFFLTFIYLFLETGEGREKERKRTSMCSCLLRAPHWEHGLQPRHVPWLGMEPVATLWLAGSVHWASPARAICIISFVKLPLQLAYMAFSYWSVGNLYILCEVFVLCLYCKYFRQSLFVLPFLSPNVLAFDKQKCWSLTKFSLSVLFFMFNIFCVLFNKYLSTSGSSVFS